jgi:hypothetical protein
MRLQFVEPEVNLGRRDWLPTKQRKPALFDRRLARRGSVENIERSVVPAPTPSRANQRVTSFDHRTPDRFLERNQLQSLERIEQGAISDMRCHP